MHLPVRQAPLRCRRSSRLRYARIRGPRNEPDEYSSELHLVLLVTVPRVADAAVALQFRRLDGKYVFVSNNVLNTKLIENIRRSGPTSETFA